MTPGRFPFEVDHRSEEGQAMVEYALILALVTVVSLTALTAIGTEVTGLLDALATKLGDLAAGL
jgi:Flp pilus assembly pilin Flp